MVPTPIDLLPGVPSEDHLELSAPPVTLTGAASASDHGTDQTPSTTPEAAMTTSTGSRWARLVAAAVILGLCAAWSASTPASAHAVLRHSDPANGSVLRTAPAALSLQFSESVSLRSHAIRLYDATGQPIASESGGDTVTVAVGDELSKGSYVLSYRVTSADGHPISGAFEFSVREASAINFTPSDPQATVPLTRTLQAVNGLNYAALLVAVGLAVFLTVMIPASAASLTPLRRRLAGVVGGAAGIALLSTVVLIPLLSRWQAAGSLRQLLTGRAWAEVYADGRVPFAVVAPPALVLVGLVGVRYALRAGGERHRAALVVTGGALALSSLVINGHPRSYGPSWVSYPIDLLHVSAAAVWLGSLTGLTICPFRRSPAAASDVAATVSRFSGFALATILVLSAAGVVMSGLILNSVSDLVDTGWGITLVVKVGLVGVILAVAGLNRWRLLPYVQRQSDEQRAWVWLRRTLRFEAVALIGVVAVTGVLVTQSPVVATPPAVSSPAAQNLTTQVPLGDGSMTFSVEPVQRGKNTVTITLEDAAGKPVRLAPAPTITTRFAPLELGPFEQRMVDLRPGAYAATVVTNYPGQWSLTMSIRLDQSTQAHPEFPVDIP